jgi:hypothetical protein
MKKLAVFASLSILGMVPQVHAQNSCNQINLQGVYSFVASGTLGSAPFVAAGQTTYDGAGAAAGSIQISMNGTVTPVLAWSGTYTMNPDCTATKAANIPGLGTIHFYITWGDQLNELRFIATDPGTTISGTARKQ